MKQQQFQFSVIGDRNCFQNSIRRWSGLLFWIGGVAGLFLSNSLLLYDKLIQVDDTIKKSKGFEVSSLSSDTTANQRYLELKSQVETAEMEKQTVNHHAPQIKIVNSAKQMTKSRKQSKQSISAVKTMTVLELFQQDHPTNDTSINKFVKSLRDDDFDKLQNQRSDRDYNIYNCPDVPLKDYPQTWYALEVLNNWGVDDTDLPTKSPIHQGLCVFNWSNKNDRAKAEHYRTKELPFVVQNHPGVMETARRWMTPNYLEQLFGDKPQRNEHGPTNNLMFWRTASPAELKQLPPEASFPPAWKPPTEMVHLSYKEWLQKAKYLEKTSTTDQAKQEHFYFRINAYQQVNHYLYDELPFFDPIKHNEYLAKNDSNAFLIVDEDEHRGINCRFGQRGTIAALHFDSTRNFVVLLGGQRRYILAHPGECQNVDLYDRYHPSGRHSKANWSHPMAGATTSNATANTSDPPLSKARINEVVLQAGDVLYLPTYWFHMIVSLTTNYQCNSRSGVTNENYHFLEECGMSFK